MYSELVYDYECRTVTPDEAAAMLGGAPKDNPHDADDACPAWEPLRVIFDHKGRLLLGTDELAHIVGAGRPMDAAIYHEPARPEDKAPERAKAAAPRKPSPNRGTHHDNRQAGKPDDPSKPLRWRVVELLRRDYADKAPNAVNWAGVAVRLTGDGAGYDEVRAMLAGMDVGAEYDLYRLALRVQRSGLPISGVAAAVTMHRQAEHAPLERVVGFWSELADRKSALRARVANVPKDRLEQAIDALWKEYRA